MSRLSWAAGVCVSMLALSSPAQAYMVTPLALKLSSAGRDAQARLTLNNHGSGPVDLEIVAERVAVDDAGRRTFSPEPAAFAVFPQQLSVSADASQVISVRYVGDPRPTAGQIYALRVKQTNITLLPTSESGVTVKLAQNMIIMVSVNPDGSVAPLRVTSPPRIDGDVAKVTLKNDGPGVADIASVPFVFVTAKDRQRVPISALQMGETRFVPPGGSREVQVSGAPQGARLDLAPPR